MYLFTAIVACTSVLRNANQLLLVWNSCRGIQTAQDSLKVATGLLDEAMLLCFDDFQGHVKRHAQVPPQLAKQQGTSLLISMPPFPSKLLGSTLLALPVHNLSPLNLLWPFAGLQAVSWAYMPILGSKMALGAARFVAHILQDMACKSANGHNNFNSVIHQAIEYLGPSLKLVTWNADAAHKSSEEAIPGEVVARLSKLNTAMQRHNNSACIKVISHSLSPRSDFQKPEIAV